ncbi:Holliday junction branch migration protein RuvA [Helicobacter vulpis]|uniref:Holliday junction branch migration protein RuvA n=1 Tax=Helicobacter vulpis TaxID=2316076 RepID=UPI000EB0B7C1|nr:Holliday junction branch migration protein RuvA [Helicobacter vulpis]
MIVGLVGNVEGIEPTFITLNVSGVIYGVHVSLRASALLQEGQEARLYTTCIFKEDAHDLYGFLQPEERALFERLLKINGVGARVALSVLSLYGAPEFGALLKAHDLRGLQKVPGVGKKLAGKIMLDLEGYLAFGIAPNPHATEAALALESLGFKSDVVHKVCAGLPAGLNTQEIIKQALQQLR